jgi:hypothetical protein
MPARAHQSVLTRSASRRRVSALHAASYCSAARRASRRAVCSAVSGASSNSSTTLPAAAAAARLRASTSSAPTSSARMTSSSSAASAWPAPPADDIGARGAPALSFAALRARRGARGAGMERARRRRSAQRVRRAHAQRLALLERRGGGRVHAKCVLFRPVRESRERTSVQKPPPPAGTTLLHASVGLTNSSCHEPRWCLVVCLAAQLLHRRRPRAPPPPPACMCAGSVSRALVPNARAFRGRRGNAPATR